jgi:cytochrome bd-type quinol oxidase subunit 2
METLWFCLVALMLAGYVILDGFDLGAGVVHFLVGKNRPVSSVSTWAPSATRSRRTT